MFVTVALVVTALAVMPHAEATDTDPHGLRVLQRRISLLGEHTWYPQTFRGIDVLGGLVVEHVYDADGTVRRNRRVAISGSPALQPRVTAAEARARAGRDARDAQLAIAPGAAARLVWSVLSKPPTGATRTLVDASDGTVISVERLARDAEGTGRVFAPNPVVTLRDTTLVDADDTNHPALAPAYRDVTLRHLDGSGFLRGHFAFVGPTTELRPQWCT